MENVVEFPAPEAPMVSLRGQQLSPPAERKEEILVDE
jgi:hypothetical protein